MPWFRMESTFAQHRKIKQLARRLQIPRQQARGLIVSLFCRVCAEAPDGCLCGWEPDDIADAADWPDDPDAFIRACKSVRLLVEGPNGNLEINDWMRYAESYKIAQRVRKHREKSVTECNVTVTECNVPMKQGPDQTRPDQTINPMSKSASDSDLSGQIRQIWDHYRTYHSSAAKKLKSGRKEYRHLKARLEEFTVEQLKRCIDGYHKSSFHNGDNDRGIKYLSAELFFRSASHVQRGIEFADGLGAKATRQPKRLLDLDN